jgi:integrase
MTPKLSFSSSPPLKPNRRVRVALRLEDWPDEDQALWQAAFTEGELFEEVGRGAHLAPRTRLTLARAYGHWLGFLGAADKASLAVHPSERVTRQRIVKFCKALARTNRGRSIASQLRHLRNALRLIAPTTDTSWLLTIAKQIESQCPPRDKRARLRLSDELDALADKLMERAEHEATRREGRPTMKAALYYRDGLIIALLTIAPMRRRNICSLTLGRHVIRTGTRWTVVLPANETKGRQEIEYPLPEKVSRALDRYLEFYRPAICGSSRHQGLWASAKGAPATDNGVYLAVCRRTRREFGTPMNLHLFRDAGLSFLAFHAPEQVHAGRDLLGHKNVRPGEKHYLHAQSVLAARKVAQIIASKRT